MASQRNPTVVVQRAGSEHLEVLRAVPALGAGRIERVDHAHALDGLLLHAVDHGRLRDSDRLENGRGDVDHVMELRANTALVLDALGPADDQRVARSAEVRSDLFAPFEGRVHGPRPAHVEVVVGLRTANLHRGGRARSSSPRSRRSARTSR